MDTKPRRFYEFGPFRLDAAGRRLLLGGREVTQGAGGDGRGERLPPKAFDLLLFLVEHPGETLGRGEILDGVWADAAVEPGRVDDTVSTLRKFLGDRARNSTYIETVPKSGDRFEGGYRFAADVREVVVPPDVREVVEQQVAVVERTRERFQMQEEFEEPAAAPGLGARPLIQPAAVPPPAGAPRTWMRGRAAVLAAVLAALAALAGAAYIYVARGGRGGGGKAGEFRSLAVLPLRQLGAVAPEDEYLGQGLADALITRLSNVRQVAVRPTSAVLKYGSEKPDLAAVAREQRVDAVLDGSFQRAGDRVRVTVQLVRASDGSPLWAETFDERFTDLFAVQDAISARVAEALKLRLSGEEAGRLARRQTVNPEAYQLYLRGRYHWNRRTADGMNRAVEYLSRAVAADPSYALAHSGLADAYALLPEYTNAPFHESLARARESSLRALELDGALAEAHVSLALVKQSEWDWDGVEEGYRRGLDLNPNYAAGRQWYSEYLVTQGRTEEALAEIRRAQQLDPLSLIINARVGMSLYYCRRYDEAIEQLRRTLEFDPDFGLTHIFLYGAFYEKGMHGEAIPHVVRGFFNSSPPEERASVETALRTDYGASGERALWERLRDLLEGQTKRDYNYAYNMAEASMRVGDRDAAFLWLGRAVDVKHPGVAALKAEPAMDGLRDDPRYAELLRRLKLQS